MADHVRVRESEHLCEAAIYRPQGAIERAGKSHVIERVDQFLEAPLRTLNHLAQLVQLLIGGSDSRAVVQIVEQMLELGDLPAPAISVGGEQDRQHQKSDGNSAKVIGKVFQSLPGKRGQ